MAEEGGSRSRGTYKRHLYPDNENQPLTRYAKQQLQVNDPAIIQGVPLLNPEEEEVIDNAYGDPNENAAIAEDLAEDNDSLQSSNDQAVHEDNSSSESDNSFESDTEKEPVELANTKLLNYIKSVANKELSTVKSVAEILIMVVSLSLSHNMSLSATCSIFEMFNIIFSTQIFPQSQYLLKNLFNPEIGMTIHFCCEFCGHYLGKKTSDDVLKLTCSNCKMDNIVKGYKYEYCFITMDVKHQLREMVSNDDLPFKFALGDNRGCIRDINDGTSFRSCLPPNDATTHYLSWSFNSDGAPLSRDTQTCIVPILLTVNELSCEFRTKNVILAGLWFGKAKPRMDVFLRPFVEEMNTLRTEGFHAVRGGENITVKLVPTCCVVDSVARAPMQGINGIGGYYSCSWCLKRGESVDGTVKFSNEINDLDPRTENNFRAALEDFASSTDARKHVTGVKGGSPLNLLLFFMMVWGFVPDYMHATLQGVVKRFLMMWASAFGSPFYIGSPSNIDVMDKRLKHIRPPSILRRLPILISMRKYMKKARELENWFLFYSVPVLTGILPTEFLNHWKLLINAIYLLLQDEISIDDLNAAEIMLIKFVYTTEILYGKYEITYNMHQHLHFAESVRRWGPLWAHTAFPYENKIGVLKKVVKSAKGIPNMIVRNIEFLRSRDVILQNVECSEEVINFCNKQQGSNTYKVTETIRNEKLFGQMGTYGGDLLNLQPGNVYTMYKKFISNGVIFESRKNGNDERKFDNSYVELENGKFSQIVNILLDNSTGQCYAILEMLSCEEVEGLRHMKKVVGRTLQFSCNFDSIKNIAVHVDCNENIEYVCSVPRKHYLMNL